MQVWPFALTTVITLAVFLFLAEDWIRDVDVSAARFLLGVLIEGAGLAAAFVLR